MSIWRPSPTIPPWQPQPVRRQTAQSAAIPAVTGTIATNLTPLTIAASGWHTVSGTVAANLPSLTITASGTGGSLPVNYYSTSFPATENPMSEGGVWVQGGVVGLDWNNIRTTTNKAFGTQDGNQAVGVYNDSIAHLLGMFGSDQIIQATVFSTVVSGDFYSEVELLLRFSITAHSAQGYEVIFSTNPGNGYAEIVRWNGPRDSFLSLQKNFPGAVHTGDVITARISSNTITGYINGTAVVTATDSTYSSGNPGYGHWLNNESASADPTTYGLTLYTAETMPTGTAPITLPGLTMAASGAETFTGTIAANLPALTISATGVTANVQGAVAANLTPLTMTAAGTQTISGTALILLPRLTVTATGAVSVNVTGTIAANLPALQVHAIGTGPVPPPLAGTTVYRYAPNMGSAVPT